MPVHAAYRVYLFNHEMLLFHWACIFFLPRGSCWIRAAGTLTTPVSGDLNGDGGSRVVPRFP
jgi:hypothetical protein